MHAQVKTRPDDTRARIIETAEGLFRRIGYAKTAVADIASELGMSPANVYRFFPSKVAIVQAICQRCLGEINERVWAVARARQPASERLERLRLEILAYHKENLLSDQKVNDIVLVAMEENWDAIAAHREVVRNAVELILRDGIDSGEFAAIDPRDVSAQIERASVAFCHPVLIAQGLQDGQDLEAGARALTRFLLRAITPAR